MSTLIAVFLSAFLALPSLVSAADGFQWIDTPGKHTDLRFNGRNVMRYIYERIDTSSPERRELTYKPFHHVYDAAGKDFITKGPGGTYPHHRGIYYGFSSCSYIDANGETHSQIDTWHCPKASQTHEKFLKQEADAKKAVQRVAIDWHDLEGVVFAREERQLTIRAHKDGLTIDFASTLTPAQGKVTLDGDPQHAGFQFRASNEVSESTAKQTYYIRPKTGVAEPGQTINWKKGDPKTDPALVDLPWKAMSFVVGAERYTTLYLDSALNPKPAVHSERDYGRFGSYFVADATVEKPVSVHYRLHILKGELTPEKCAQLSAAFK